MFFTFWLDNSLFNCLFMNNLVYYILLYEEIYMQAGFVGPMTSTVIRGPAFKKALCLEFNAFG